MKRVSVEIWSDFACPWCWIAKRRFEKAVLRLAGQIEVTVIPKSYRLAKGMVPEDIRTVLANKFGSYSGAERMMASVAEHGAMEKLQYNFETMRFGDTSDAHALVKSIESLEIKHKAIERIFMAYTTEGVDIFNRQALITIAKDLGISETELNFDSSQIAQEIAQDELNANRVSNGVPLFVFNGDFHLSGARPAEEFENALLRAANAVSGLAEDVAGQSCGIDGCTI